MTFVKRILFFCLGFISLNLGAIELNGDNQIIFSVIVNEVSKGDILAIYDDAQSNIVWISKDDFEKTGIEEKALKEALYDEQVYLKLQESESVSIKINWDTLSLSLNINPEKLGTQRFNFSNTSDINLTDVPNFSGFINYSFSYINVNDTADSLSTDLSVNLSLREWILKSNHSSFFEGSESSHTRIASFAFRDWPDNSLRFTIGDLFANAGQFGRGGDILGVKLEKMFELSPGYISSPVAALTGTVTTPSTAEIYVDGTRLRTIDLAPGRYEFEDIYYYAGLRDIDVQITDNAGNQSSLSLPYYFSDSLLTQGLHEYSYSAGLRRQFNQGDNSYSGFLASAVHRYGLTDDITLGLQGQVADNYRSFGLNSLFRLGKYGISSTSYVFGYSPMSSNSGHSASASYSYSGGRYAASASYIYQSKYFNLIEKPDPLMLFRGKPQHQFNTGLSLGLWSNHNLSLDLSHIEFHDASTSRNLGVRYSWNIRKGLNLDLSLGHRQDTGGEGFEGLLNLSLALGANWNTTSRFEKSRNSKLLFTKSLTRSAPTGIGSGGSLNYEKRGQSENRELFIEHNRNNQAFAFSARQTISGGRSKTTAKNIRSYGSLAFSDGDFYFSRAIGNSFATVDTKEMAGVRVYQNNQFVGKTDAKGKLLVPVLGDYISNQIRIDDRDIPMDFQLETIGKTVSPRTGVGIPVRFDITRMSAIGGFLFTDSQDQVKEALESAELEIFNNQSKFITSTGPDGDFYLDNIPPGLYTIKAQNFTNSCSLEIDFSEESLPFSDLGELICDE